MRSRINYIRTMWKRVIFVVLLMVSLSNSIFGQNQLDEKKVRVALREVGHRLLLASYDSTSRIFPITNVLNDYTLEFDSGFYLSPSILVDVVDSVFKKHEINSTYIVEAKECETGFVSYSYEMNNSFDPDEIPCRTREHPTGCYTVHFLFEEDVVPALSLESSSENEESSNQNLWVMIFGVLMVVLGAYYILKRKPNDENELPENTIQLGLFEFNHSNMILSLNGKSEDLTGKEADLLKLLFENLGNTVKREDILNNVWGDDGDYIGRTLDVFISKLRKKLEGDSSLKIVNIRGVGYRLVQNED